MPPYSPGWCHQPGPKVSFRQPKGREAETFGPGWWHQPGLKGGIGTGWWHQPGPKVGIGPGWCHEPGPKDGAARGQKFSPTSLAERAREWFISAATHTLSSSSQQQAYGPIHTLLCLWAFWAFCGPESWPNKLVGFLVVFRPWWPSRRHFF